MNDSKDKDPRSLKEVIENEKVSNNVNNVRNKIDEAFKKAQTESKAAKNAIDTLTELSKNIALSNIEGSKALIKTVDKIKKEYLKQEKTLDERLEAANRERSKNIDNIITEANVNQFPNGKPTNLAEQIDRMRPKGEKNIEDSENFKKERGEKRQTDEKKQGSPITLEKVKEEIKKARENIAGTRIKPSEKLGKLNKKIDSQIEKIKKNNAKKIDKEFVKSPQQSKEQLNNFRKVDKISAKLETSNKPKIKILDRLKEVIEIISKPMDLAINKESKQGEKAKESAAQAKDDIAKLLEEKKKEFERKAASPWNKAEISEELKKQTQEIGKVMKESGIEQKSDIKIGSHRSSDAIQGKTDNANSKVI